MALVSPQPLGLGAPEPLWLGVAVQEIGFLQRQLL
jgi:hypothetical protein